MPSLTGSRRRLNGKQTSQSKKTAPPPAPLSIRSENTSELSAAMTTPKGIFQSSLRPSKRPGMSGRGERPSSRQGQAKSTGIMDKENVDVFAFMEDENREDTGTEDEPDSESSPPSSPSDTPRMIEMPQKSPRYSDLEVRAIQEAAPRSWRHSSLHSDSGISVRTNSPDPDSPILKDKCALDHQTLLAGDAGCKHVDPQPTGLQICPSPEADNDCFEHRHRHWPSLDRSSSSGPEAYQVSSPQLLKQHAEEIHQDRMPEMHARPASSTVQLRLRRDRVSASPPVNSGYNLLASNIGSKDDALLKPIYRKFEILNNRMLLYLQDEIAQMEDDLRELDAAIAIEDVDLGRRGPASRRSEAKLPSQLQWHRMDLMGRTFAKVEQYNRALTSYSNLTKSLEPASHADVTTYRQWIREHTPIAEQEAAFLKKESDLLSVVPPNALQVASPPPQQKLETPIIVVAFALVSTIIVFKVVPSFLARLVISMMVGLAALATLCPDALTSVRCLRTWGRGIAMYSSVMLVLSIVVA